MNDSNYGLSYRNYVRIVLFKKFLMYVIICFRFWDLRINKNVFKGFLNVWGNMINL